MPALRQARRGRLADLVAVDAIDHHRAPSGQCVVLPLRDRFWRPADCPDNQGVIGIEGVVPAHIEQHWRCSRTKPDVKIMWRNW